MMSRIAVLDDYQGVALDMADWSQVSAQAEVVVFDDHLSDADAVADRLRGIRCRLRHAGAHALFPRSPR